MFRIIRCQKCNTPLFIFDQEETGKIQFGSIRCKSCLKSFQGTMTSLSQQFGICTNCKNKIEIYSDLPIPSRLFKSVNYFNEILDAKLFCSKTCYKLFRLKE